MFFKTSTVYKVYNTERGAQNYINKFNLDAHIEQISGFFYVVSGGHN